jgi:segregation and condensation protein A
MLGGFSPGHRVDPRPLGEASLGFPFVGYQVRTVASAGCQVRTPAFEGPFELLLQLVARQQVDIWELSIASIVDDYLAAIERMQALDLGVATEFLLLAALLLELKVRRLLPEEPSQEGDEELALWEERDLLLARLLECKTFKDASSALERLMEAAELSVPRRAGPEEPFASLAPDPLEGVRPERLRDALLRLLAPRPMARVNTDHVAPIRASVADTLEELVVRLPKEGETTFRRLTEGLAERLEVIVCFLALLELYKRGAVDLVQAGKLAELHVRWTGGWPEEGEEGHARRLEPALASTSVEEYDG